MSDGIKEFSRDEASSFIFNAAPNQGSMAPVQQAVAPSAPVAPPTLSMPAKGRPPASIPDPTQLVETVSKANKKLKEETPPPEPPSAIGGLVDQITNNWKPIAITAAATYAATKAAPVIGETAKSLYTRMKDRNVGAPVESTRIDPVFATADEMLQAEAMSQKAGPTLNPLENLQKRAEDLRAAVQGKSPIVPPQFGPANAPAGDIPPAPPYMPSTPLSSAPDDVPAPKPSSGPNSFATTTIVDEVKDMIQNTPDPTKSPELRTGTGKPAFGGIAPPPKVREKGGMAGKPIFRNEYARPEDVPAGYAFVPNAQFIDPGRQDMGQPLFTKTYGAQDYPLTDKMAREQASEINRMLGKPTRTELKAAGLEPAPNTPGITQYINQPKGSGMGTKTVRVGGTLGALIAIPDLAKAETAGQRGMAGANLLEAILPPGFMMGGAGEGSSTVPSVDAAMLLGSPYAQTEIAKKRRQQEEYTRKVGAGRGIAPPSAYLR
jgi:hypothetical protein